MSTSEPNDDLDTFEWVAAHDYQIKSVLVENDGYPDELAIFDASGEERLTTTWLAASGDESFVDLEEVR